MRPEPGLFVRRVRTIALITALAGAPTEVDASPPDSGAVDRSSVAIPPEHAEAIAELLGPDSSLRGPSIDRDRVKWWLMRGDDARAMLLLVPVAEATADDPTSQSFAIRVAWAEGIEPTAEEREQIAAAIDAIQRNDAGGYYLLLMETSLREHGQQGGPPQTAGDVGGPLRWWLELGVLALALIGATAITLRPLGANERRSPNRA